MYSDTATFVKPSPTPKKHNVWSQLDDANTALDRLAMTAKDLEHRLDATVLLSHPGPSGEENNAFADVPMDSALKTSLKLVTERINSLADDLEKVTNRLDV